MNLNFAENFKRFRKEKGATQEKIAEELGVSSQSVSRWELSICYPDIEMLPSIANYFGTTVDTLLSNDADSKEKDRERFNEKLYSFSDKTSERIDFVSEYCKKYPEDDYYSYQMVLSIRRHLVEVESDTEKYMPLMLKNAQRLLETRYRNSVIENIVVVCDEKDLEKWLSMCPYHAGFSRRGCLLNRASARDDWYVQSGLQMLETLGTQLDSRYPDKLGAGKKAEFHKTVLRVIKSFGRDGEVPDGWKMYYAYKQLVLCACLFRLGETDEAWKNFDEAIETCKYRLSMQDEWLDLGGEFFSNLKVSPDWNYAIDENGNKHKLFAVINYSFFDMREIGGLLTDPRWKWFNSVRETDEFKAAAEWANEMAERFGKE